MGTVLHRGPVGNTISVMSAVALGVEGAVVAPSLSLSDWELKGR